MAIQNIHTRNNINRNASKLDLSTKIILESKNYAKLGFHSPKHTQTKPIGFTQKFITNQPTKLLEVLSGLLPKCMPFSLGNISACKAKCYL